MRSRPRPPRPWGTRPYISKAEALDKIQANLKQLGKRFNWTPLGNGDSWSFCAPGGTCFGSYGGMFYKKSSREYRYECREESWGSGCHLFWSSLFCFPFIPCVWHDYCAASVCCKEEYKSLIDDIKLMEEAVWTINKNVSWAKGSNKEYSVSFNAVKPGLYYITHPYIAKNREQIGVELTLGNERATEWKMFLNIEIDSIINRDSELVAFFLENAHMRSSATWGENQQDITEQFSLNPATFIMTIQQIKAH